jgi:ketosteroid isomerase-like protein
MFRGHTAIRDFMDDWLRSYDRTEVDLEEVVDLGSGVVFIVCEQKGRLAGSGGEVAIRYAAVILWVDSLIESVTNYLDTDEARAAAECLAEERG